MFKAAYKTEFYRAVRDALHAEVDSWRELEVPGETDAPLDALWRKVNELEPLCRDAEAFGSPDTIAAFTSSTLVTIEQFVPPREA
jgi:hypothetical protein